MSLSETDIVHEKIITDAMIAWGSLPAEMRVGAPRLLTPLVIPGHAAGVNPESISDPASRDSGSPLTRRPE
jgi:hypothetical protein